MIQQDMVSSRKKSP